MRVAKSYSAVLICLLTMVALGRLSAQAAAEADATAAATPSGCNTVNGTLFNLEPRLNAQPQNTESVDFLLNRVGTGADLIVGAVDESAFQSRFVKGPNNGLVFDAFYVHRSGTNCTPDLEGTTNASSFGATDTPTVVADAARDQFFLVANFLGPAVLLNRSTAATLLSPQACANGTEQISSSSNTTCWPVHGTASFASSNPNVSNTVPTWYVAVDPRTSGTGEGDVYIAAQVEDTTAFPATSGIQIIACTNVTLTCGGTPVVVSGTDTFGASPYVQVRSDGVITISYWTFTKPFNVTPNPIDIKFVTCTPQGAPLGPVCSTPALVATDSLPGGFVPGDSSNRVNLFPKHANRTETDGTTFTTFLIYDRCHAKIGSAVNFSSPSCSKIDLALTESTNNGATWSPVRAVESAPGHQFFGVIKVDESTRVTNIAYYSTQHDPFLQRAQILLNQIPAGSTTVSPSKVLTSAFTDPDAGIQDFVENLTFGAINFGNRIGLAVAGTGTKGQSRLYVHYTWNDVSGISNGTLQPDPNNTLVSFTY